MFSIILIFCVPALQVNYHRNGNIVPVTLIAVFIALCIKDHMRRKVPEFKDFYEFSLCSNTIVSTCLVAMRLMSSVSVNISTGFDTFLCLRKHIQESSVYGNISTAIRHICGLVDCENKLEFVT